MSLIQRIPPLVSALAFGYGVGMAAPESTITSMEAAVTAYHASPARMPAGGYVATAPLPLPVMGVPIGGRESSELSRLRQELERERGASCDYDRPVASRASRYESRPDTTPIDDEVIDDEGSEALSRLQLPDLRIPITKTTLKYVRFFSRTDRGRGMYEAWLKRSGTYQDLIQGELRQWQLPEDLIWVAMIESGFDARAKSPAGAMGLWQFMPATGAVYGLQRTAQLDQRKNPRLATQAAAHHLRDLYMRFGAWELALAAYNMGYEQLLDRIDRYGTTDFNELARQQAIPSETASYVPKIAAAAIIANNLEHFGFDRIETKKPIDFAEIAVPPGTPMKTLAKAAGVSTSAVRQLNPDILGERVPPGRGDFLVMVPAEALARAQASLPALLQTEGIGAGDASVLDPVDLLGGSDFAPRRRAARDEDSLLSLLPPPKAKRRATMRRVIDGDDDDARDDVADLAPKKERPRRTERQTVYYRVGPGDTLLGVARQFAADIDDVAEDNDMEADGKLRVGALLKLRVRGDVVALGDRAGSADKGDDAQSDGSAAKNKAARPASEDKLSPKKRSDKDALGPSKRKVVGARKG